jgi:hypothetical protein
MIGKLDAENSGQSLAASKVMKYMQEKVEP